MVPQKFFNAGTTNELVQLAYFMSVATNETISLVIKKCDLMLAAVVASLGTSTRTCHAQMIVYLLGDNIVAIFTVTTRHGELQLHHRFSSLAFSKRWNSTLVKRTPWRVSEKGTPKSLFGRFAATVPALPEPCKGNRRVILAADEEGLLSRAPLLPLVEPTGRHGVTLKTGRESTLRGTEPEHRSVTGRAGGSGFA